MSHLHHDHSGYLEYFTDSEIIISDASSPGVAKLYALGQLQEHGGFISNQTMKHGSSQS
jgi:glyoxylase-like metal-dependent hydrolase (beta-lactamase superfamily II)